MNNNSRDYLTPHEVKALLNAARKNRHGLRDYLLVLITFRHALRVSEAVNLKWSQIDFSEGKIFVEREKNGDASVHFLEGEELRKLRELKRLNPHSPFVFISERNTIY